MRRLPGLAEPDRLGWFLGFALASWTAGLAATAAGHLLAPALPVALRAALLFTNPFYFALLLAADLGRPGVRGAVIGGAAAAPLALWLATALVLVTGAARAQGEEIVSGLSQNRVAITANFDGSEILIYGAVKREAPAPTGAPLEVIITVEGPSTPLVIRRKERVAGIWVNTSSITVDAAPSFYAVATTGLVDDILSDTDDLRYRITLPHAIRVIGGASEAAGVDEFIAALERIRSNADIYRLLQGRVQLVEETLFRTDVTLPANLIEGDYMVRMFITRDGQVIDHMERVIGVRKTGLERTLFVMAHEQPLLYGLISLLLAIVAGWAASAGFRLLRR
jgi:uncharacterized protein (TIGR02186 family)